MTDFRTSEEYPYFIYRHIRLDTGKPFYIGRGKCKNNAKSDKLFYQRAFNSKNRTEIWRRVVTKHGYRVEILMDSLTLEEAKNKEAEFVKIYKRLEEGGILVNFKNGGEDNLTNYKHSSETIEKFSAWRRTTIDYHFNKYVVMEPSCGCWLWVGTMIDNHPKININKRTLHTRRFFYENHFGLKLTPKADVVQNICGCSCCVNPYHSILTKPLYGVAKNGKG